MGPREIRRAFSRLVDATTAAGGTVAERLRPGLSPEEITSELANVGVSPHPHLIGWFSAHNGTDLDGNRFSPHQNLGSSWQAVGLHEMLRQRQRAREILVTCGGDPSYFPESWFPISRWSGIPLLCLDTEDEQGRLFEYEFPEGDSFPPNTTIPAYSNIIDFVDAIEFALENEYIVWEGVEDGGFYGPVPWPKELTERYPNVVLW